MRRGVYVALFGLLAPGCSYRAPAAAEPVAATSAGSSGSNASTSRLLPASGSSGASTSGGASTSPGASSSSSGGGVFAPDLAACVGAATLQISNPAVNPGDPAADGGASVGLLGRSDAGTLLVIAAGAHPLQAACDAVVGTSCGQCTWFSLWIPAAVGPGTYDVVDAGLVASIPGLQGTVTLAELTPDVKGSLSLHELPDCGLCDEQVRATFDIPAACEASACSYPPPLPTCGTPWQGAVPSGPGGPGSPTQVVLAPLQGPGSADALIVDDLQSTAVDTFLPLADGGFGAGTPTLLVPLGPGVGISGWNGGIATADLDEDGFTDVIDATWQGVGVLLGHGDGTLALPVFYGVADGGDSGEPSSPRVADFDGDGHLDVAVGDEIGKQVVIFRGLGDGTLVRWQSIALPGGVAPLQSLGLVTADFNGDGHLDLVASTSYSPKQLVFIAGAGADGFGAAVLLPGTYGTSLSLGLQTLVAAQLRPGSGRWDLVEVNNGLGGDPPASGTGFGIDVLLGNGDGTFAAPVLYSDPANDLAVGGTAVADVDGDGNPDLIALSDASSAYGAVFAIWRGTGTGTFTEWGTGLQASSESGFATETSLFAQPISGGTRFAVGQPYSSEVAVWTIPSTCIAAP